ncbi:hypothetical protein FQB35_12065 [Crassaminicella thermophila]|uniref:Uncharacterized protein n=1 Tax=Crassaminicella thermophila TaxID=2599308 RepID=A0A5C0SGZ5_CRATE|nr:hypothetical protein [Crassaminicella thermophila]QEK12996.1 hypothetical protein FQB35_12065 [Crassaminicella thermophila]
MTNKKGTNFNSDKAQDMIDSTYNSHDYPIIEKTQNAYVMPLNMQRDVDAIDSLRFYEDTTETTKKRNPESKKHTKLR